MTRSDDDAMSSSTSSSSSSSAAAADIAALRAAVARSPTYASHLALVDALRRSGDLAALRAARHAFAAALPLPPAVWAAWLSDERALADTPHAKRRVAALYDRALADFYDFDTHHARLQYAVALCADRVFTPPDVARVFDASHAHGATYHVARADALRATYDAFAAHQPHLAREHPSPPLPDLTAFEARLVERGATPEHPGTRPDHVVHAYLSYATHAASVQPLLAVNVYERAVTEAFQHPRVWRLYLDFLRGRDRFADVAMRATRSVPHDMAVWSCAVRAADTVPALATTLSRARPFVMESPDLAGACRLCKHAWSRYLSLGAPAGARDALRATLDFNVRESPEWASATAHAAAVLVACGDAPAARALMEDVVAVRPEARWWLCFARLAGDDARAVYERALRAVAGLRDVHVVRDAWETFEVLQGGDGLMERLDAVAAIADVRLSERLKGSEAEAKHEDDKRGRREKRRAAPAKRRRAEEKKDNDRTSRVHDQGKEVVATENGGVENMEEVVPAEEAKTQDADGVKAKRNQDSTGSTQAEKGAAARKQDVDDVEPKTIFVNNLAFAVSEADLSEVFAFAGKIAQIRLPRRSDGATKGIAYVEFEDDASVDKALTKHNTPVKGRSVWVRRSKPPPRKGKKAARGRPARRGERGGPMQPRSTRRRAHVNTASVAGDDDRDVEMADGESGASGGAEQGPQMVQDDFRAMLLQKKQS